MIESTCFKKNPPASPSSSLRTHGNPHPLSYRSLLTTSDDCDLLYAGRMLRIYCLFSVTQNLHCVLLRPSGRGASPKHPPLGVVVWEGAHPDSCNLRDGMDVWSERPFFTLDGLLMSYRLEFNLPL